MSSKTDIIRDGLSREELTEERVDEIREELRALNQDFQLLETNEREALRQRTLLDHPRDQDLWIFGYGSLMWNPAFNHGGMRPVRIYGFHRRFCLSVPIGRGSIDNPGLMLALAHGGACRGLAIRRIAAEDIESETEILWRREMISGAYIPTWLTAYSELGTIPVITFVANEMSPRYTGWVDHHDQIRTIATATGQLGRCRDYLHNTVVHLREIGLADGPMERLLDKVDGFCPEKPE